MKDTLRSETEQEVGSKSQTMSELGDSTVFRCDACGAQAFAAATKGDMLLLFCGHHFRKHSPALDNQGWTHHDYTHKINEKPSQSANV